MASLFRRFCGGQQDWSERGNARRRSRFRALYRRRDRDLSPRVWVAVDCGI